MYEAVGWMMMSRLFVDQIYTCVIIIESINIFNEILPLHFSALRTFYVVSVFLHHFIYHPYAETRYQTSIVVIH